MDAPYIHPQVSLSRITAACVPWKFLKEINRIEEKTIEVLKYVDIPLLKRQHIPSIFLGTLWLFLKDLTKTFDMRMAKASDCCFWGFGGMSWYEVIETWHVPTFQSIQMSDGLSRLLWTARNYLPLPKITFQMLMVQLRKEVSRSIDPWIW